MIKQALRTYWASLHPRNFKKAKENTSIPFWMIYWLIFSPMNAAKSNEEEYGMVLLFYVVKFVPLLLLWWSNIASKIPMPKAMFLVPMKREEREQYISAMMLIKIGVPAIISVVLHLLYGLIQETNWIEISASAFAQVSFGIGMYVCSEMRSKFDRYIKYAVRGKDGTGKDAWLNWMCMMLSFFLLLIFSGVETSSKATSFDWIVLIGGAVILLIMDIVIIKTRYTDTVQDICTYEVMFDVRSKV